MRSIITEIPLAFSILCLLLGAGYAALLYFRERRHELPAVHRAWLGVVRFVLVSAIAFFLLSPLVRSMSRETEDPVVIIAQDNSRSNVLGPDSIWYRTDYLDELSRFAEGLDSRFEVHRYIFGDEVSRVEPGLEFPEAVAFSEERTDIAGLFRRLSDIYENRNVGALVLASDGLYNSGMNPVYGLNNVTFPVYTLGLGDTNVRKDILIAEVRYNRMAYLNNAFPLEVTVLGNKAGGETSRVEVYESGSRIATENVTFEGDAWSGRLAFTLKADKAGLRQYEIVLREVDGETNTSNNRKSIYIDVLDRRNRILILSAAPHPDISAMKEAIRSNMNFEVEDALAGEFNGNLEAYNLVILHQLPSVSDLALKITDEMLEKNIPALYVIGPQSNLARWNSLQLGLDIQADQKSFQEVLPDVNKNFSLFTIPEEMVRAIGSYPPLTTPFGKFQASNAITPFIDQRIGNIATSRPLVCFGGDLERRWGVIAGTGIWRWRLMSFQSTGDHEIFNELVVKIVQYLSLRESKQQFRIFHDRNFFDNQAVTFEAEVYNDSYELVTGPDVEITITNDEGEQFPFSFMRMNDSYFLEGGTFPEGKYSYTARVSLGDTTFVERGAFTVTELDIESMKTTADHNLLINLSAQTGGRIYGPRNLEELSAELMEKPDIRPVVYTNLRYLPLMDMHWILIALVTLLALEWFTRRRLGSY